MNYKLILFIGVLFIAIIFACGCMSSDASSSPDSSSASQVSTTAIPTVSTSEPLPDAVRTQDFASFALTVADLPPDWQSQKVTEIANDYVEEFCYEDENSYVPVTYYAQRCKSVDDAKDVYHYFEVANSNICVDSVNIGNDGFAYEGYVENGVVFRNGNIVVKIYSHTHEHPETSSLVSYAQIVNSRIHA